ncbi:putative Dynein gamma chain, flagellar outer arm [Blattamonas nauphoetae]|uniref:Dynein gamma chain, flagellar outer arm n=1 Tax=Blattamonas nauphoetae TaxID=2049346 RepID=A0ABQ9YGE6_9EUKA|nr:putative Dynein gamma chain, flagellar outer arm [Blattamonas nauphoetae]
MFPSTESFKTHTYYSRLVHINSPQFPVYSRIPTQEHSPKNSVDPDPISFICPRCHYSANSLVTCTNHLSLCTQFVSPEERLNFLYELQIEYVCRSLQRLSDWQTAFDAVAQNLSKFTPSINTTPHFDTKPSPRLLRTDFQMVVEWLTAIFVPVQLSATIRVDFSVVFEQYITRINEWRSIMIRFLETTTRTVTQQLELRGNEDWREVTNTEPPQSGKMTWSLLREHETLALMENEMKILNIATIPAINQIKAKHNHTPWAFKLLVKIESLLTQYGPVNAEVIGYISHAKEIHAKLSQLRKQLQDTVLKEHAFFVAQLESRRQTLMMEVKIYIARVNEMGFEADVSVTELSVSLGHLVDGTTRVLQNLMGKKATIEVLNSDESLLGEPITLSTELDQTIKRIEYLNQVFVSYQLFTGWQNDVRQITFEFDVGKDIELLRERKEILERCQNIRMEAKEERLSTPHPLEKRMMQSLEDNLTKLLILADFDKMSFRDRHWKSLETLTHSQLILASSTRKQNTQASCPLLGVLLDLDLVEVRSEITDLLHTASREQEIELELKGILKEWENDIKFEFVEAMTGTEKKVDSKRRNTSPHDTPFHLKVTEESCERIVTLAKSTSTTLRTLSFSDYIGPFKDLTEFLEQRLHNIPSLISIFMSTQNTWRTLNGVFMSSFVLEMLVKEHWTFNKITDDLNRVMRKMISEKTPFTCFCQDSFIPHVLEELHVQLEQCKKGVVSHFTKVAETSPRLSLLSESSLFTVLSYASSPLTFDPILQQLFPGVAGLVIDQKLTRSEPGEQEGIQEAFHILHNADNSNDEISSNFSEVFDVSDATSDSVSSILSPTNRRIKPRPRAKRHSLAIKPSSPFPGTLALPTPPEKPQVEIPFSANERLSIPSSSRHPKPFKSKRSTSLISIPQRMALSPQLKSVREAGSKDDKHAQSLVEQPDCVLVAGMAGGMGEVLRFPSPVPFYAGANPMHFFVQIEKAMQDAVYVSLLRTYGMVSLIFNSIRGGARQNADVVSKWHEESIDSSSTDFLDYMSVSTMTDTTQSSETGSTSFNSEAISGFGGIGDDRILGRDSFTDQTFTQFIGEPDNSEMFAFAESAGESGNLTSTQMLSSSEEKGQEISFRSENEFEKMIAIIETKIKPSELPTLGTSRSVINNSVDQCIYTSFVSHLTDEISDLIEVVSHVSNALWIEREARGHGEFDKQQAIDKLQIVSDAIVSFIEMFQTMVWSNISVILRMKIESTLLACLQSESLVNHIRHFLNGRGPQKHWSVVRQSVKNLPHLMIPVTDYNRELVESMFRDIEGTTLMSISGIHPQRSAGSQFKSSFHSPTNIYSHTHEISSTEEELTICDKWPILVIAGEESMKYGCDYLGMVCGTIRTWSRITVDEDGLNKEECETLYRTTHFWKAIIKDVNKDVSPSFGSDPSSPDLPAKQTDSKLFTLIEQGLVTESFDRVKELSVICGKYVFVMTFHVESVVPPGFAHYFQGICGSGSWAYFILPRMITHKPVEALGALFEKLHQSIDGGHKHCLLNENVLIGLKGEYHFFVEIPQKASNLELPDSLRSSLRAGVFGRVSSKSALYSGLVLSGFYFAGLLSTRINRFFELFKEIESSSVVFVESGLGRVSETIRPYFERVMYNIVRPLLQTNFKANGKFVADLLVWANVSEIDQDDNTQTFSNVSGTNIEALRRLAIEDRLRFVCECLASVLCIIAAIRPSLKGEEVQTASTLLCQIFKEIPARFIQEHLPLSDHYFEFSTLNDLNALGREVNKYTIPEEMEYNTKLIEITKHTLLFDPLLASQDIQPVPSGTVISRRNQFDLKNYAVTSFRSFSERVVDVTKKLRDKAETSFDGENSARGVSTTLAPTDQSIVFSMSAASGSQNITDQSQNHNLLVYAPEYFAQMRMSEDDHISMDFAEFTIKTVTPALKFTKDHMLKTATDAQSFMVTGASQSVVLLSQMLHHPSWCKGGRWTSIPQPQPVAVVGPAGSGKSLVIELLAMAQNSLGIPTSIVKVNPSASSFTDLFGNLISTSSNSKVDGDDLSPHSDSALTYKVGWVVSILKQYARKLMQHSFRDERHPSQNETAPIHELFLVVDLPPSTNQNAFSMDPIIDTTEKEEDSQAQNATFESFAINRSFYQAINRLESALIQEYLSRLVISRKQLRTDLANEGLVLDNPRTSDYTTIPELFNLLLRDGSLKETKAFTQKLFHLRNKNRQSRISASSRRKQRHFRTRSKQRRSPFRHHSNDDQSATVSQHPSYLEAYRTAKFEEKINKRTSRRVRKGALGVQENSYIQYLRLKLKNRRKAKELQKRTDNLLLNEIERIHQLSHNVTMQDLSLFAMGSNIKLIFEVDDIATIPPSIGQHLSILRIPDTVFKAPCRLLYYREVSVFPVFWMQMAQRVHTVLSDTLFRYYAQSNKLIPSADVLSNLYRAIQQRSMWLTDRIHRAGEFVRDYFLDKRHHNPASNLLHIAAQTSARSSSYFNIFCEGYLTNVLKLFDTQMQFLFPKYFQRFLIVGEATEQDQLYTDIVTNYVLADNISTMSIFWGVGGHAFHLDEFRDAFSDFIIKICPNTPHIDSSVTNLCTIAESRRTNILGMIETLNFPITKPSLADFFVNLRTGEWENSVSFVRNQFTAPSKAKTYGNRISMSDFDEGLYDPSEMSGDLTWGMDGETSAGHVPDSSGRMSLFTDELKKLRRYEFTVAHVIALYDTAKQPVVILTSDAETMYRWKDNTLSMPLTAKQETTNVKQHESFDCPIFSSTPIDTIWWILSKVQERAHERKVESINAPTSSQSNMSSRITSMSKLSPMANSSSQAFSRSHIGKIIGTQTSIYTAASSSISYFRRRL